MKTFESFHDNLTRKEKAIVTKLRRIVLGTAPDFSERISYGVPYYFLRRRVCFIWPASVRPGPPSGVLLGFCYGNLLSDEDHLLEKGERKQVYWMRFHSPAEIDEGRLRTMLHEAIMVDEQFRELHRG